MDIEILYEDDDIVAINKLSGLLVHPVPGQQVKTLVDWLRDRYPGFEGQTWPDATRPGIVHRLDRDTSGVMVIAKTPAILAQLQTQFAQREIEKVYLALCAGTPEWDSTMVRAPVSRGEGTKRKASYLKLPGETTKDAETDFRLLNAQFGIRNPQSSIIEARPKTGRTHQIRVHLNLLGYPILGDPWYQTKTSREMERILKVPRLMLHAQTIRFIHPVHHEQQSIEAPLSQDFQQVLQQMKEEGRG